MRGAAGAEAVVRPDSERHEAGNAGLLEAQQIDAVGLTPNAGLPVGGRGRENEQ